MARFALLGPTYPYRGGIAHYMTLLAQHLRQTDEVLLISFSRQYPTWLFPGKSDKDPTTRPLQTAAEYLLDPLNPVSWRRTVHRLQTFGPEVIVLPWWHPYFAPAWFVLVRRLKRLPGRPQRLFICHNVLPHEQSRVSRLMLPPVLKTVLSPADGFMLHSQADARILRRLIPEANYEVAPLPTYAAVGRMDTSQTSLPVSLPADRPLLLFCGLVRPYKGVDVLLEALAIVRRQRPCHLLVAGEIWQGGEGQYRQQIERLQLGADVTLLNRYLPDEVLAACIDRAQVVVLPYKSATQSAVIQLAFGRQTPVITTEVGGLGEVVTHGRTGLVVPPADPSALATAINTYFDGGLEAIFSRQIQAETSRFSWPHYIERLKNLVNRDL